MVVWWFGYCLVVCGCLLWWLCCLVVCLCLLFECGYCCVLWFGVVNSVDWLILCLYTWLLFGSLFALVGGCVVCWLDVLCYYV